MTKIMKREDAPFHVTVAKNVADRAAKIGVKRADALESFAIGEGSKDWNTFVAQGEVKFFLQQRNGHKQIIPRGLTDVSDKGFSDVISAVLVSAYQQGMSCEKTAPILITDESGYQHYPRFARTSKLRISKTPKPGCMTIYEGIDAYMLMSVLSQKIGDYEGVIILDLPGVSDISWRTFLPTDFPKARILRCAANSPIRSSFSEVKIPHYEDEQNAQGRANRERLLKAVVRSGMDFDPQNPPDLDSFDRKHPDVVSFLKGLPGWSKMESKGIQAFDAYAAMHQMFV